LGGGIIYEKDIGQLSGEGWGGCAHCVALSRRHCCIVLGASGVLRAFEMVFGVGVCGSRRFVGIISISRSIVCAALGAFELLSCGIVS
jgi:hypothetical protein